MNKFLSNPAVSNLPKFVRYKYRSEQNRSKETYLCIQQTKHEFEKNYSYNFKLDAAKKSLQTKNIQLYGKISVRTFKSKASDDQCGNSKTNKATAKKKKPYWEKIVDQVCNKKKETRKKKVQSKSEEYKKCGNVKSKCKTPDPPCSKKNERTTCEIRKQPCNRKDKCEKLKPEK